jgi:hypothetical protein
VINHEGVGKDIHTSSLFLVCLLLGVGLGVVSC